jgi:hypothetical protein
MSNVHLLLAIKMVALTPLAYIDTADQVWLGGFYGRGRGRSKAECEKHCRGSFMPQRIAVSECLPRH